MAWTYDKDTGIYTVAFEELDSLLKSLDENTKDTPYTLNVTGLTNDVMKGSANEGTIGYVLYQNNMKYISLNESEGSVTATLAIDAFSLIQTLVSVNGDFSTITDATGMFSSCYNLISVDDVVFTNVTNAEIMFQDCPKLTFIDASTFTNVIFAHAMFANCINLTSIDTSGFTNVSVATYMFQDCPKLTSIDTSVFINITNASSMFADCIRLISIDTTAFGNVTNTESMFINCIGLTSIDTTAFGNVTWAHAMFADCINLTSIDKWGFDLNKLFNYSLMFPNSLTTIYLNDEKIFNEYDNSVFDKHTAVANFLSDKFGLTPKLIYNQIFTTPLRCKFSYLNNLLSQLKENTIDTPYELDVYELDDTEMTGSESEDGGVTGTIQYVLQQNDTKFISLNEAENSISANEANCSFFNVQTLSNIKGNFSSIVNIYKMFALCTNLTSIDTSGFSNATNMKYMFYNCSNLKFVKGFNFNPYKVSIDNIFKGCNSLQTVTTKYVQNPTVTTYHAFEIQLPDTIEEGAEAMVNIYTPSSEVINKSVLLSQATNILIPLASNITSSTSTETSKIDEIIFEESSAKIAGSTIQEMMNSKYYITTKDDVEDPAKNRFILWAKDKDNVIQNIADGVDAELSDDDFDEIFA